MQSLRDQADANINMAPKVAVGHCHFSELSRPWRVVWQVLQVRSRKGHFHLTFCGLELSCMAAPDYKEG